MRHFSTGDVVRHKRDGRMGMTVSVHKHKYLLVGRGDGIFRTWLSVNCTLVFSAN